MRNVGLAELPVGTSAVQALLAGTPLSWDGPVAPRAAVLRGFAVCAAHGGAGASTVAAMLDPVGAGIASVVSSAAVAAGRRPVLVARDSAYGTARAAAVLAEWPQGTARPVLVVVAAAPCGAPAVARFRLRVLAAGCAGLARVPYLHALRAADDPVLALDQRPVARAAVRLRQRLRVPAAGPAMEGLSR